MEVDMNNCETFKVAQLTKCSLFRKDSGVDITVRLQSTVIAHGLIDSDDIDGHIDELISILGRDLKPDLSCQAYRQILIDALPVMAKKLTEFSVPAH